MRRKDREVVNSDWIWNVIAEAEIMHLAMIDPDGHPYALSVHYGYDRETKNIYFHGAMQGRKADTLRVHPEVAFNIIAGDEIVPRPGNPLKRWGIYKSVMGTGRVSLVEDPAEKIHIILKIKEHYGDLAEGYTVKEDHLKKVVNIFTLAIDELTGKVKGYPNPDNPRAIVVKER